MQWDTEINDLTNNAWDLLNNEFKKGCPNTEYSQALKDYIDALEKAKNINIFEAAKLGFGVTEPLSNLPIIPTPPVKPTLPGMPLP